MRAASGIVRVGERSGEEGTPGEPGLLVGSLVDVDVDLDLGVDDGGRARRDVVEVDRRAVVQVIHGVDAPAALFLDGAARLVLLLRVALLAAAQALGRRRRSEVGAAVAAAGTSRRSEPSGARAAEAAAPRPWAAKASTAAEAAAATTESATARPRSAEPTAPGGRGEKLPGGRGGRSSRARASLTARLRPWNGCASNRLTTSSAAARSTNSTKAKPRGRPVSRSTGITTCEGSATAAKWARRSASLAP